MNAQELLETIKNATVKKLDTANPPQASRVRTKINAPVSQKALEALIVHLTSESETWEFKEDAFMSCQKPKSGGVSMLACLHSDAVGDGGATVSVYRKTIYADGYDLTEFGKANNFAVAAL